jgi:hypothetical protein
MPPDAYRPSAGELETSVAARGRSRRGWLRELGALVSDIWYQALGGDGYPGIAGAFWLALCFGVSRQRCHHLNALFSRFSRSIVIDR